MHVDDADKLRVALMEYAQQFFLDVRSPPEVYGRFVLCINNLRDEFVQANKDGRVTPAMAEAWSWFSLAVPAMLKVIFKDPKWGTRELEQQLNDAFVLELRNSKTTTIKKDGPAGPGGISIEEVAAANPDTPTQH